MKKGGLYEWQKVENFQYRRASHQMVSYKDSIFILFGILSDSSYFNDYATTNVQFSLKENKTIKEKESNLTCSFSKCGHDSNFVYFFGGKCQFGPITNLFCLNLENFEISRMETKGITPSERLYHCSTVENKKLYIFGGETNDDVHLNDLHSLDLETFEWKEIFPKFDIKPKGRRYASTVSKNNMIYLFGGRNDENRMNDMWQFNLLNEEWSLIKSKGEIPQPMTAFSCVIQGYSIFYFGGNNGISLNSLYEFYIPTSEWRFIKTCGVSPSPRYWHTSCLSSENEMIIQGGFNADTLNKDDCWKILLPKKNYHLQLDVNEMRISNLFTDVLIVQ
jgi:hypothetical protein